MKTFPNEILQPVPVRVPIYIAEVAQAPRLRCREAGEDACAATVILLQDLDKSVTITASENYSFVSLPFTISH